ncbi:hypothetical protein QAD02_006779 [Eretmocerus hayati]|uniref:Uncharacterized protein n=1 Tax=Eretmocerus hayati TaxID=131215 RepID=A0ACC2N1V5_9HYME|nr:hypothetical protein QAD02_006779 [Eretmocerus hayati]
MVGGKDAVFGEYTFNVVLKRNEMYFCSGAIIGPQHVITAAHCVIRDDDEEFQFLALQVVAGTNNYANSEIRGIEIDVVQYYVLSEYYHSRDRKMIDGDIAVLQLANALDLSRYNSLISSLDLPANNQQYVENIAMVFGFGWNSMKFDCKTCDPIRIVGGSLGNLRYAETEILQFSECPYDSDGIPYGPKHVCARIKQRSARHEGLCNGDSGGPLVYDDRILIAIVRSNNLLCDETYLPSVYTEIAPYREFIVNSMTGNLDESIVVISIMNQESNNV